MIWKLNLRFLLLSGLVAVLVGIGWFFTHRFQKSRRLADYLAQATRAEEEKKPDRAARLLRAYIIAVPSDLDARFRYAALLENLSNTARAKSDALAVYEQALRLDPERHEQRRRATELAVELNRMDDALIHIGHLLNAFPNDGRALYFQGLCEESKGHFEEAAKAYEKSCAADPKPEPFVRWAGVRKINLKQDDVTAADGSESGPQAVLNDYVKAFPNSYQSYLARAAYRKTYDATNGLKRATADLAIARKLAPDDRSVLIASATVAMGQAVRVTREMKVEREAFWEEARGYLRHGIAKLPKDAAFYLALAEVESYAGRRDEAIKVLTDGRKGVQKEGLPDVLFALAEHFADSGDETATEDVLGQLAKLQQDTKRIDFYRGVSLVRQRRWYDGSGVLEKIRPLMATSPGKAAQIDLLLAQCYGSLGDIDRQLVTYRRAVTESPLDYRPRYGLAGSLASLGRTNEAIDEYRHITQMEQSPVAARIALARLLVYRNLTRPESERQWGDVTRLLGEIGRVLEDSVEVPLLNAEVLLAQGNAPGAKRLLTEKRDARPMEPEYWIALATLTDRGGDNKAANAVLDSAVKAIGDTADLRLARLRITEYTSADQAAGVLKGLSTDHEKFPAEERVRLLRSLASAFWMIDRPNEARELWKQIAATRKTELAARLFLFDAALKLNEEDAMKAVLEEIGRIEGNGPLERYGKATLAIWRAEKGERGGLPEARDLLAAAAARRPGWSRIPLALARIDEFEGNPDLLLEHLKQAVDLGDRQIANVKKLVQLLDERGRGKDADDVLRRLEAQAPISNDLQRLAAEVSIRLDTDRALTLARKAIDANSKDYKERVWLARILSAGGRRPEAEVEFEAATAIAADKPEVWVAYVQHAVRNRRTDAPKDDPIELAKAARAEALVKRAEAALAGKELLALAICYELIGKRDEAEKRYLAAIQASPKDVRAVRATATFYQKFGEPIKAEPFLRQLLTAELKAPLEEVAWGRRNLALALGVRDEPGFAEAVKLLDANKDSKGNLQVDDMRTKALITSTRPGRRQEVIALFEQAETIKPPQPEHEFILAKLYEAEGQWPKARARMLRLIGLQKENAGYVAAFANSLVRRGEYSEAAVWVGRLTDVVPNSDTTIALRTQVLSRLGRASDAVPLIRAYVEAANATPDDPIERALVAADLLDQASWSGAGREAADAAEKLYRKYRDLAKRPDAGLPLAGFYGRRDDPEKALALCEEALTKCPVEQVISIALSAVSGPSAKEPHFAKVEGWLNRGLKAKPESNDLRFLLGTLYDQQKRFADAEREYRGVIARLTTHAGALNNLAFLLAMSGKGPEAVLAAQRAFATVPTPPADLLDTRAVAYTAAGDLAAAKKDLEAAIADGGSATAYFHLAVVYHKMKDKPRATTALRQAKEAGLRAGLLHPLERPTFEQLAAELKP